MAVALPAVIHLLMISLTLNQILNHILNCPRMIGPMATTTPLMNSLFRLIGTNFLALALMSIPFGHN